MTLAPGTRLGPYEIQAALGAGGMGEVYRARDTRLERTVAIKVLAAGLVGRPEIRKRFEREARALSGLSHPHICTLHDIGCQDGVDYLVMEYLEGETLAQRLNKGPLPAEQVLRYGVEIADALEKAHRQNVVHRDLKPGNIMLTKAGAKLLDFGLARLINQSVPAAEALTQGATQTRDQSLTEEGVILGTFQYMAPEQLEGKEADARTDIFALGELIYEMATGKPAFSGKSRASLIAAILTSEPPAMAALQPLTPPALERVVKTCLAKDPDARWQSAQDLKLQLVWIAEGGSQAGLPAPVAARRRTREQLAWALAGLLAAALIALGVGYYQRVPAVPVVTRFVINPPEQHAFGEFGIAQVSPDGRKLVLVISDSEGKTSLWLRPLDSVSAHELPGTEGAGAESVPVWLPDSRFLLFVAEGKLKRMDTMGGLPDVLCDVKEMSLGIWNSNGTALLAYEGSQKPGGIRRLNLDDCSVKPVIRLDPARYDRGSQWPSFLPDGKHFVYAGLRNDKRHDVLLGSLASEAGEVLVRNASDPKYAPPGYLFFERNGYLFAQPFSLSQLRLTGEPLQVVPQQLVFSGLAGFASYDVSSTGVLVYQEQAEVRSKLILRDTGGKELEAVSDSGTFENVRLAPNRKKLLASKFNIQSHTSDLWTYDVQRKNWERFSFESSPGNHIGVWSADGQTIVYVAWVKDKFILYRKPADRSRDAEALLESDLNKEPTDWSRDGRFLLYTQFGTTGSGNVWVLPLEGERKPFPLAESHFEQGGAHFSPDGHWVAYRSDESGRGEIYVRPFPGSSGKWQISSGGGHGPHWSPDGKRIYYVSLDKKLMEVPVKIGATVEAGTPRTLFSLPEDSEYEVMSEGKFLINEPIGQSSPPITVVLNWDAALGPKE